MSYAWIHEDAPEWDEAKESIIGGAPDGIFHLGNYKTGGIIPGDWWRVEQQAAVGGLVLGGQIVTLQVAAPEAAALVELGQQLIGPFDARVASARSCNGSTTGRTS